MTTDDTPIGGFRLGLPPAEIAHADALRVRSLATWACIALMPGFAFLRQRSEFVQGFEAAARAGGALGEGASAGAVGVAGASAIGTWMMLPEPSDARTQTVLASTDTLYGMALLEFDRHGPLVLDVARGLSRRALLVDQRHGRHAEQRRPPRAEVARLGTGGAPARRAGLGRRGARRGRPA